jgi:hypothetical protein
LGEVHARGGSSVSTGAKARTPNRVSDLGFVVGETVSRVLSSRPSPERERRSFI